MLHLPVIKRIDGNMLKNSPVEGFFRDTGGKEINHPAAVFQRTQCRVQGAKAPQEDLGHIIFDKTGLKFPGFFQFPERRLGQPFYPIAVPLAYIYPMRVKNLGRCDTLLLYGKGEKVPGKRFMLSCDLLSF